MHGIILSSHYNTVQKHNNKERSKKKAMHKFVRVLDKYEKRGYIDIKSPLLLNTQITTSNNQRAGSAGEFQASDARTFTHTLLT